VSLGVLRATEGKNGTSMSDPFIRACRRVWGGVIVTLCPLSFPWWCGEEVKDRESVREGVKEGETVGREWNDRNVCAACSWCSQSGNWIREDATIRM